MDPTEFRVKMEAEAKANGVDVHTIQHIIDDLGMMYLKARHEEGDRKARMILFTHYHMYRFSFMPQDQMKREARALQPPGRVTEVSDAEPPQRDPA